MVKGKAIKEDFSAAKKVDQRLSQKTELKNFKFVNKPEQLDIYFFNSSTPIVPNQGARQHSRRCEKCSFQRQEIRLLITLLWLFVFFCNRLQTKARGSFKSMCQDIVYSRKH